ncbi:MAG: hypothetical protein K2Y29_20745 [Beijerinckiaceae bacterium]|nr:hypothetical protein [Beijerinckiaceae bacterium]
MTAQTVPAMPPRSIRVMRGLASGAFSIAVRIGVQLAQVPLLLSMWGVERYGEWLLLAALPIYLSLSGAGVSTIAGNMVSAAIARGEYATARSLFRAAWTLVALSNLVILVLAALCLAWANFAGLITFKTIPPGEAAFTILLIVALVVLRLQAGLLAEVVLRARGRYGEMQIIETLTQIAEFLALAVCVFAFGDTATVAAGLVAVRAALLAGLILYVITVDRLLLGKGDAPLLPTMGKLIGPSFALLLFPVAQAIQFEGILLAMGYWLGPAAVALYVTMRTLARFSDMALIMVYNVLLSEASYLGGREADGQRRAILGVGAVVCVAVAGTLIAVTFLGGLAFFPLWTAGKLAFDKVLFGLVVGIAVIRSLYVPASALIVAENRHTGLAFIHLASAIAACALAILIGWSGGGLYAMVACALLGEAILAFAAVKIAGRQVNASFIRCIVKAPKRFAIFTPIMARITAIRSSGAL